MRFIGHKKRVILFCIVVMCIVMYIVDRWEDYRKQNIELKDTHRLQRECMNGREESCVRVYNKGF